MPKNWKVESFPSASFIALFPEFNPLVLPLLYNRGLREKADIENFLKPDYSKLHNPFLFLDMEKAVERVWLAINKGEKIVIYGDYDADAVTANAVLTQTFRYLGVNVGSYIPDRFTEGYGLNIEAFERLKAEGVKLVITVDCGTNSVDAAKFCSENGMDLIITDHHEITGEIPKSFALINPKNPKDEYPDDQITGVGVAYKLAVGILEQEELVLQRRESMSEKFVAGWDKWLLDLVAIGTVADCHSLFGENHILVKYGLMVLEKTKWLGLRVLLGTAGVKTVSGFDTYTLGFVVAPRINAAGRLEHANIALDLLLETDEVNIQQKAQALEAINFRRQEITARMVSEGKEQAELLGDKSIVLVSSPDWAKGVVGLVAGRLANDLKKPVIALERGVEESTGSARSVGEFNLVDCLKSASEFLVKFGGHKQAAGLTVKTKDLDAFYSAILNYAHEHEEELKVGQELLLDAELTESDLTLDTYHAVAQMEPFGIGNPKPKFLVSKATVVSMRKVGKDQSHLQIRLRLGKVEIDAIGFNQGYLCDTIEPGSTISVAAELMLDGWNGQSKLKLRILETKSL